MDYIPILASFLSQTDPLALPYLLRPQNQGVYLELVAKAMHLERKNQSGRSMYCQLGVYKAD